MSKSPFEKPIVSRLRDISDQEKAKRDAEAMKKELAIEAERNKQAAAKAKATRERHAEEKRLEAEKAALRRSRHAESRRKQRERAQCSKVLTHIIDAAMKSQTEKFLSDKQLESIGAPPAWDDECIWDRFYDAGFKLVFHKGGGVLISWKSWHGDGGESADCVERLWIDSWEVRGLTESSEMLTSAMKEASVDGSNFMTLICKMGCKDIVDGWEVRIRGFRWGVQLPTCYLTPPLLVCIFQLLGFQVDVQWSRAITCDDDFYAAEAGGSLVIRW